MKFWRNKKIILGVLAVMLIIGTGFPVFKSMAEVSVGGVYGGAAGGAAVGAVAGSVVPGVGTAFGAFAGGIVGALGGLLLPNAVGDIIGGITSSVIYYITYVIAYLLGFIASATFYLGGQLVTFALKINLTLLNSPIIESGWQIVLSFANLGFVLAIIIIAFATIFRLENYAMKQVLWKLIVAALLVNFSLVIAGAFINVSDVLAENFNAKISSQGWDYFSLKLAKILDVQALLSLKDFKELKELQKQSQSQNTQTQTQTQQQTEQQTEEENNLP